MEIELQNRRRSSRERALQNLACSPAADPPWVEWTTLRTGQGRRTGRRTSTSHQARWSRSSPWGSRTARTSALGGPNCRWPLPSLRRALLLKSSYLTNSVRQVDTHLFVSSLKNGSFSAVPRPIFATKHALESSWRDLQFPRPTFSKFCRFLKICIWF